MRQTFSGENVHKMDKKGRASVPASYRTVLAQGDQSGYVPGESYSVWLTYAGADCKHLEGYTVDRMNEIERMMRKVNPFSKARKYLERMFKSRAVKLTVEVSGRLVIPDAIQKKVGLEVGEILFVGMGERFQIWDPAAYEADQDALMGEFDDLEADDHPLAMLEEVDDSFDMEFGDE